MRYCACPIPEPKDKKRDRCVKCDRMMDPATTSNDDTVREFMDRLADSIPDRGPAWDLFRLHIESREFAGRPTFRQTFLGKDLLKEGREESADSGLYALLHRLQCRRDGTDEEMDLILTWAYHAYKAYETTLMLNAKHHSAP